MAAGITWRAVICGLCVSAFIGGGAAFENLMISGSTMNFDYSSGAAVFVFALFALFANPLISLVNPKWVFRRGELATIYIMAMVSCVVPTVGLMGLLIPAISGGTYYATPENRWLDTVMPYVKPWLVVTDPDAVKGFYEGIASGAAVPWATWLQPILGWLPLIVGLLAAMLAIMILLHKQWITNERLLFPLAQVPIAMIGEEDDHPLGLAPIFRQRLFWVGVLVPALLYSLRALHNYHPAIPEGIPIWVYLRLADGAVVIPWQLNFAGVGFGYLLTTKLSFSIWFLGALTIAEEVVFARLGFFSGARLQWNTSATVYPAFQGFGAMLMFSLIVLWAARKHLRAVLQLAWRGGSDGEQADEILSYRLTLLLLCLGLTSAGIWLCAAGMSWWLAACLLAVALLLLLALTRIVAEGGLAVSIAPVIPSDAMITTFGSTIGASNLVGLALLLPVASHMRTSLMSSFIHGLKLADIHLPRKRHLLRAVVVAIALSAGFSAVTMLWLGHAHGGVNLSPWFFGSSSGGLVYQYAANNIAQVAGPKWDSLGFVGLGAVAQLLLTIAYQRLHWWPIHPLGLPIGAIWCTHQVMISMFVAWALKSVILHYGGARLHRAAKPLFLGLILGQYLTGGMWLIIDGLMGMQANYLFYW